LSLDNHLSPEVLALFDDTQPVAVSIMWSPIVLVCSVVFHLEPLFNQGRRMSVDWPNVTGVL
jgi:hypothetical protein